MFMIEVFLTCGRGHSSGREIVNDGLLATFLKDKVDSILENYTLTHRQGFWAGGGERSFTLSVFCDQENYEATRDDMEAVAESYCRTFDQECVLLGQREAEIEFIGTGLLA